MGGNFRWTYSLAGGRMIGIVAKYRETQIVASGAGWVNTKKQAQNAVTPCVDSMCALIKTKLGIRMFRASRSGHRGGGSPG